jgi:hypothetical protein
MKFVMSSEVETSLIFPTARKSFERSFAALRMTGRNVV